MYTTDEAGLNFPGVCPARRPLMSSGREAPPTGGALPEPPRAPALVVALGAAPPPPPPEPMKGASDEGPNEADFLPSNNLQPASPRQPANTMTARELRTARASIHR